MVFPLAKSSKELPRTINRNLDQNLGTLGNIRFRSNKAAVLGNDLAYNRQAEACPLPLGREIGQEKVFVVVRLNSMTGIGEFKGD
jgi:hypothetical protein